MNGQNPAPKTNPPALPGLPDPKGTKVQKIPLENLYITHIGRKNEIQEITLCQKKIDENGKTYFLELITKNKYTTSKDSDIYISKIQTFLSILNNHSHQTEFKTILKNGYITTDDIVDIYSILNEDHEYETKYYSRGDGPVYHDCPIFLNRYKDDKYIPEKDDENIANLVIKLTTSSKIIVLNGNEGTGKSTLLNKLNDFIKKQSSYFPKNELWKIDYNELINGTISLKHLSSRIKNTFKFLSNQPPSILFIDDVDFNNKYFLKYIEEFNTNKKTKLVLIPKKKINENDLNQSIYNIIEIKPPKEETQRKIIHEAIKREKEKTKKNLNLSETEEEELITILLNTDKTNSLNNNHDSNPTLAKKILENAFKIASAYHQSEVYLHNFYYAMCLDNINIAHDATERTIKEIDELSKKVDQRKKDDETSKTKKISYRLKNIFSNKK